ncbi:MAG: hypothetical protein FD174_1399 [Geobacteraceae bacterium]|nr:MAG: hypothetical protein FD174_1399 [Geobacteraceae bacterium]
MHEHYCSLIEYCIVGDELSGCPGHNMLFTAKKCVIFIIAACALPLLFIATRIEIRGDYEGIYLLKGDTPLTFTITDDIFHGEQDRVLYSAHFRSHSSLFRIPQSHATLETPLTSDWHEKTGRGYVTSIFPNGTKLITCFGRYLDEYGNAPSGLFVGGNLPFPVRKDGKVNPNATGMAFFNGRRWNHVWCSVNEAFLIYDHAQASILPSQWELLDSKVLKSDGYELIITSRHVFKRGRLSFLMERFAFFRVNDAYFVLANKISNTGSVKARLSYVYGDEPWVGNYGSSSGDVGWVKDRIVNQEGAIDTGKYTYAGLFDYGNSLSGEGHNFTRTANFIEWLGNEKPDLVFFSNKPGNFDDRKQPLTSDTRFVGLEWGPKLLQPGQSNTYTMAIGMAGINQISGLPYKPDVYFPQEAYDTYLR